MPQGISIDGPQVVVDQVSAGTFDPAGVRRMLEHRGHKLPQSGQQIPGPVGVVPMSIPARREQPLRFDPALTFDLLPLPDQVMGLTVDGQPFSRAPGCLDALPLEKRVSGRVEGQTVIAQMQELDGPAAAAFEQKQQGPRLHGPVIGVALDEVEMVHKPIHDWLGYEPERLVVVASGTAARFRPVRRAVSTEP